MRQLSGFRHDREQKFKKRRTIAVIVLTVLLLLLLRGPLFGILSGAAHVLLSPVLGVTSELPNSLSGLSAVFSEKSDLIEENRRLVSALELVLAESLSHDELRKENAVLKEKLGRSEDIELLLARVIARPDRSPYDTLIVDVGSAHGVVPGMKAFGVGDFVIGEVTETWKRSAVVSLYSSYGTEISVEVGTSSTAALALGIGGGDFRITLPGGLDIVPGDIVRVPSLSPQYAGVIEAIDAAEGSSLMNAYFTWPFNINELNYVYIATFIP